MGLIAINSAILGFDIVWDKVWFNFIWKYFKEGRYLAERHVKERNIDTIIRIWFGGYHEDIHMGRI